MITDCQSEEVALGLFFIMLSAVGNKMMMNINSASAETICIQSILKPFVYIELKKTKPRVNRGFVGLT